MDAKEEVRSRLAIEDVIGDYVQLSRSGRSFKGLSPFTSEKTPSFFVSPEKQIWHDFSSNRGGDVFSFVMEAEGIDFREALERLARKAGVDLSVYQSSSNQALTARKKKAVEVLLWSTRYFQASLAKNQHAARYVFEKRKISKDTVMDFGIGYAPDQGEALVNFLKKKDFTDQELRDAGVTNRTGKDLFRGRMMVPLMDGAGETIGFTGRILEEIENAPKYLNTPQTLIYDKGRHVFGLSQAKSAIKSSGYVVIVEGNLDVVASHQSGVKQVVATAGTAITESHMRILHRLTSDIRLCFDADRAGIAATERAIAIADKLGVGLSIIKLSDGAKDPDELIAKDKALWEKAVDSSQPAIEWVIEQYAERYDLTTAEGKREFTSATLKVISNMSDAVEKEHYESKVGARIGVSVDAIQQKGEALEKAIAERRLKPVVQSSENDGNFSRVHQDDLLSILAIDIACRELLTTEVVSLLNGKERKQLAERLRKKPNDILREDEKSLHDIETYVKIVLFRAETRYASWDENDRYYEAARLIRHIEHEKKKQNKSELEDQLRNAEASGDDVLAHQIREQLHILIKEIASGQR